MDGHAIRTRRTAAAVTLIIVAAAAIVGAGPVRAACEADGSVPGSAPQTIAIGTGDATKYTTIYIDDRDWADLDEDRQNGGLYLYIEVNGVAGLQRGGGQLPFTFANPATPRFTPIRVLPPTPYQPIVEAEVTLFPDGFGGATAEQIAGSRDRCTTNLDGSPHGVTPDQMLF